ncbi:MAG TPA: hypothetical protein PKE04_03790, partial [Clostridia bacterium]|nr:hypothetical protein [Clostridia bacterium]
TNTEYDVTWGIFNVPGTLEGNPGFRTSEHEIGMTVNGGSGIVVNAKTKHPELVTALCDYQYSQEMIDLTNWGIEGVTYTVGDNGEHGYTEEILNAPVRQTKLAEYGVNQSMSCRSGLLWLPQLNDAAIKLLNPIPTYYQGQPGEDMVSWEFYTKVREDFNNVLPPTPAMAAFTDLENEDISIHKTALETFVREQYILFVTGARDMSQWDDFVGEIDNYGDYAMLEKLYNSKLITQ